MMQDGGFFSLLWWEIFIGGICTLAIYSFLYKENRFYRFFEHLFIGIATGITVMRTIRNLLWNQVGKPLLGMDLPNYPDPSFAEPYNYFYLLYLLPMLFGLLYYFILSKRHNWLAQLTIGFSLGVGGGLAFKGTFNELLPQLFDSFRPLYVVQSGQFDIGATTSNLVFIFTLFTALSYFFFTFRSGEHPVMNTSAKAGRWMMMGCFGAFFGATIMARMSLLVERLDFLINQWWQNFFAVAG